MNWQSRRINFLRRWYTLLVITSLVLLTTCKDKNEINFDFNRVSGDYEVRIGCFEPDCEFKGEGIATLTQDRKSVV